MTTKRLTYENVKKIIEENNEFILISKEYVNNTTPLIIKHTKCGRVFSKNLKEFRKYTNKCTICNLENPPVRKSQAKNEYIKRKEFIDSVKDTFEVINIDRDYKNFKSRIEIKHLKCGNTYYQTWNDFQQGHGCTFCKGIKKRLSKAEVIEKFNSVNFGDLEFRDTYFNKSHFIEYIHTKCNTTTKTRLNTFLSGNVYCKHCRCSYGERLISSILNRFNLQFKQEKRFKDCKFKSYLPFDFYIELGKYKILIEYDGIQHYFPTGKVTGRNFSNLQRNDKIKDLFCLENNFILIRIMYNSHKDFIENFICNLKENVQRLDVENQHMVFLCRDQVISKREALIFK